MKQLLVVFLTLLFFASPLQPQKSASQSPTQASPDTASSELVKLTNAWNNAINAKDYATLEVLMAPEFALYGWDGELWTPRPQWLDFLYHTEIKEYTVRGISARTYGDFAIVTSVCTWAGVHDGRPFDSHTILMDTWRSVNGKWQVVARNSCPVSSISGSTASPCTR